MSQSLRQIVDDLVTLSGAGAGATLATLFEFPHSIKSQILLSIFGIVIVVVPIRRIAHEIDDLKPGVNNLLFNLSIASVSAALGAGATKPLREIGSPLILFFVFSLEAVCATGYLRTVYAGGPSDTAGIFAEAFS
ncbi:hypothetical protein [Halobacterium rubrum]|uniref:hypothetical protein n=1 Tax=Halobacterium TaxID=2239 RepID=UPI001F43DBC4|nr:MULTISPECIES: hypothetical protein [Halobacterium]MDH5019023.1 hypothetical protein [Halobacterium rubrum]